jgi:predicted peroxiredoxin
MKIKKHLKKVMLVTVILASLNGLAVAQKAVNGLFVVVTSPEPQTQMMAMVLANQAAMKGKTVQVLLCGPGADLALKQRKEVILKPKNQSPQLLLKNLIKKGVVVQVCALYLPNKGRTASDLIQGVTPAKPPEIAEVLLEAGVKLFTF